MRRIIPGENPEDCWRWDGSLSRGYGQLAVGPQDGLGVDSPKPMHAHRLMWILHEGVPPKGMTVDHKCHTEACEEVGDQCPHRQCANPDHLQLISAAENKARGNGRNAVNARKTECKRGHPFTEENTIRRKNGNRECRTCHNADLRRYYDRKRRARLDKP